MSFLTVYADASEALHGTLYGAAFHLGAYDPGAVPHDQDSLDRHRYETLSCIYLMAGGSIDTMLSLLAAIDEPNFLQSAKASQVAFKRAAIQTGLAATKAQPNQSMQPIATGCSCG